MIIIPAIDIRGGKCVRLKQGRLEDETVYSEDPAAVARKWADDGAELIHVIDLDGAFAKRAQNIGAIRRILHQIDVPIQLGGGIRRRETIQMFLDMGVQRVIVGTEAIENPGFLRDACTEFPNRMVLAIDARNGYVAVDGWTHTTRVKALDLSRQFEDCGLAAVNFTDIHRDGMQTGPNIKEIQKLADSIAVPVVASGGVSTIKDIQHLLPLRSLGVVGVIVGKALYTGSLNLKEAIGLTESQISGAR
jgi:phosphoribosylformimino-5-aminoimidazole carboxamide ribotide isomerase